MDSIEGWRPEFVEDGRCSGAGDGGGGGGALCSTKTKTKATAQIQGACGLYRGGPFSTGSCYQLVLKGPFSTGANHGPVLKGLARARTGSGNFQDPLAPVPTMGRC